jgi:prevent-host-death family protein
MGDEAHRNALHDCCPVGRHAAALAPAGHLAPNTHSGHIGLVRKTSLAEAKAHLSELVDQAEHHGKRIVILRHGKPAAAIVPVSVAAPKRSRGKALSDDEVRRSVDAFVEELSATEPHVSAVHDLIASRR